MKAVILKNFGSANNFEVREIDRPTIKNNEVLIKVASVSINPVDVKTRKGLAQAGKFNELSLKVLGWDIAGTVEEINGESKFKVGDRVFGMVNFPGIANGYAEFVAAPTAHLALIPENTNFEEAAAATLAALTAVKAFEILELKAGDRLLIHAAAGGVGHYAVQIAKHLGAYVIGTASAKNKQIVMDLGAHEFIDYQTTKISEALSNIDKVLDAIGGENIDESLKTMKKGGLIVSIPSGKNDQVGAKAEEAGMKGLTMIVNSADGHIQKIADYLGKGVVKSKIFKTYSLLEIADAHRQVESGTTVGKVIVNL